MAAALVPSARPHAKQLAQQLTFLGTPDPSILLQVVAKVTRAAANITTPLLTVDHRAILNPHPTLDQYLDQLFGLIPEHGDVVKQKFLDLKEQLNPKSYFIEERIAYARCCLGLEKTTDAKETYAKEAENALESIEKLFAPHDSSDQRFRIYIKMKEIFSDFADLFIDRERTNFSAKATSFDVQALACSQETKEHIQVLSKNIEALRGQIVPSADLIDLTSSLLEIYSEACEWHPENVPHEQDQLLKQLSDALDELNTARADQNSDIAQSLKNIQQKRELLQPFLEQVDPWNDVEPLPEESSSTSPIVYVALAVLGGILLGIGIYFWRYRKVSVIQPLIQPRSS